MLFIFYDFMFLQNEKCFAVILMRSCCSSVFSQLTLIVVGVSKMTAQQYVSTLVYPQLAWQIHQIPFLDVVSSPLSLLLLSSFYSPLQDCLDHTRGAWYMAIHWVNSSSQWKGDCHACQLHPGSYYQPPFQLHGLCTWYSEAFGSIASQHLLSAIRKHLRAIYRNISQL